MRLQSPLNKMTVKTTEMYGGKVRLHTLHTDKFKMSRFSINFIMKSDKYYTPLYKLMLSVMMRGSERYPTITDINKALDERYGASVSYRCVRMGDKSVFKISCKLLGEEFVFNGDKTRILEEVMEILSDILFHPVKDENGVFLEAYADSEKKIAIDAINSRINDPKSYASEQCSRIMFKDSDYELNEGDVELIKSFTSKELTENVNRFFDECNVECFYIGNESHDRIESLIEREFPLGCCKKSDIEYREVPFVCQRSDIQFAEEEKAVSQGRLVLGYRCGTVLSDSDYYAMLIFNEIFGGGSVSKLFMNVREKKSLCYYCYSSLHSATGTIKVGCGIDPVKKDDAESEIASQLDAMKCGDFTDDEIDTAKRTLISGLRQISDSPAAIEAYFMRRYMSGINESPNRACERISEVTREEIIDAANKVELDTVYFLKGTDDGEVLDYE